MATSLSSVSSVAGGASVLAPAAPVFRLFYRSRSRLAPKDAEQALGDILRVARAKNAELGITGALVLYGQWFAQALEGDEARVRKLLATIQADPRHDSLQVTEQGTVAQRVFSRWAMAHVGEHGDPDMPLLATPEGTTQGAPWRLGPEQEVVVTTLRDLTRGYGIGS